MAISSVKIANMALGYIGARSTIESFEEASTEAQITDLWYDESRRQTLEDFDWNFARKRAAFALHGDDAPSANWNYRYTYPSDCIIIRKLLSPFGEVSGYGYTYDGLHSYYYSGDEPPWEIELSDADNERTVVCDVEDAVFLYTANISDPTMFTPLFVNALSWRLAGNIAFSITGSVDAANRASQMYYGVMQQAMRSNANEGRQRQREAEGIRARA